MVGTGQQANDDRCQYLFSVIFAVAMLFHVECTLPHALAGEGCTSCIHCAGQRPGNIGNKIGITCRNFIC